MEGLYHDGTSSCVCWFQLAADGKVSLAPFFSDYIEVRQRNIKPVLLQYKELHEAAHTIKLNSE